MWLAGLDAPLVSGTRMLAVRYGRGLLDLTEGANDRNRAVSILTGWRVPIGTR